MGCSGGRLALKRHFGPRALCSAGIPDECGHPGDLGRPNGSEWVFLSNRRKIRVVASHVYDETKFDVYVNWKTFDSRLAAVDN